MQSCSALKVQYFFFILLLCPTTISGAYISPLYFRTKPYMGTAADTSASVQKLPDIKEIQNKSPKVQSSKTGELTAAASVGTAAPKDHPVRIMDLIIVPDAMGRFIGHLSSHSNVMRQANEQKNLGTKQQAKDMESTTSRPHRRKYDHNCFFTPVNCHPWIEPPKIM